MPFDVINGGGENRDNLYGERTWSAETVQFTILRAPGAIAESLILSLTCVYPRWSKGLRGVFSSFAESIYTTSGGCVKLTPETLTLSDLSDEHPTDWVKSD